MQKLHYNGRLVAINRDGKWSPVGEVPLIEQGAAFKYGEIVSDWQAPEKHNATQAITIMLASVAFLAIFIGKIMGKW